MIEKTMSIGRIYIHIRLIKDYCSLSFSELSINIINFPSLTYNDMIDLYASLLDASWYTKEVTEINNNRPKKIKYYIYRKLFNLSTNRTTYSFHVGRDDDSISSGVQDGIQHNMIYPIEHQYVMFREMIRNFTDYLFTKENTNVSNNS